jgi:hypothetical protein
MSVHVREWRGKEKAMERNLFSGDTLGGEPTPYEALFKKEE